VSLVFCEVIGPFLLAIIVGSIAANVPNAYTAGLGLLALRLPMRRTTSMLLIALLTLAFRIFTLFYGHAIDLYEQWLGYILVWTGPFISIVVLDYFMRGGNHSQRDLMRWGSGRYWYSGGVHWRASWHSFWDCARACCSAIRKCSRAP